MIRMGDLSGAHSTWDERQFRYVEIIEHARDEDARDAYRALHRPPMVIVRSIRYALEPAIYPWKETICVRR